VSNLYINKKNPGPSEKTEFLLENYPFRDISIFKSNLRQPPFPGRSAV